ILSDLLEIPNLNQRATQQLRHWAESGFFGVKNSESPAGSRREAAWLAVFGIASGIYRVVVFSGVLLFVADRFLIIGIIMAAVCLVSWAVVPVVRYVKYLASSPRLDRVRNRAIGVSAALAFFFVILLAVVPFPCSFRAPGIALASQRVEVANATAGEVQSLLTPADSLVSRGQPLLRLKNPELDLQIAATQGHLAELNARLLAAMDKDSADIEPLERLRDSVSEQLAKLDGDASNLVVRASQNGVWVAPDVDNQVGSWLNRGSDIGLLVNPAAFDFVATVSEDNVNDLFNRQIRGAAVRLWGQTGDALAVSHWKIIPGGQDVLPSAALGWAAGGVVPVAGENNTNGVKTIEPFFEVRARLDPARNVALLDGRSGEIRFKLPPEPLLPRWVRSLWQLLQKRYEI
ncbi:MAG: hypothetical protein KGR98_12610, partial [Verrucomicrobia bacterium]|nr:hypothetical protein [Verrucomicrobiota bacterium]